MIRIFDILAFGAATLNFGYYAILYGGAALDLWRIDSPPYGVAAVGCLWAAYRAAVLFCVAIKPLDTPETKPLSNP